jgi:hypothetical protein
MKRVQVLLLVLLITLGVTATAQRRQVLAPAFQQRLNELRLTDEQKRRIAIIIRRERIQNLMNQQELDAILTEKQKVLLEEWRKRRFGTNASDSAVKKQ